VKRGLETKFVEEFDQDQLTFWVDPLDGSSGLVEGHTEHLTCIIGVAVNKRPLLGVVHKPFSSNPQLKFGRTYVGLPGSGLFTVFSRGGNHSQPSVSLQNPPFSKESYTHAST
jgi:3'-phosphoadenosine 5'-phosphosulfate (PAPS) 3'-phosphatase